MQKLLKQFLPLLMWISTILLASPALANTCIWSAAAPGNWSDTSNWTSCGGLAPQAADDVIFNGTSTFASSVDAGFTGDIHSLTLDSGYSATITQARALNIGGDLTINAGTLNSAGQDLAVAGNFTNSATYSSGNNTLSFNGSTDQSFDAGAGGSTYKNLLIAKGSGTLSLSGHDLTLAGSITHLAGNFSQGSRSFSAVSYDTFSGATFLGGTADISLSGSLNIVPGASFTSTSGTLFIGYNFGNTGTFIHHNGTVEFNGGAQSVSGSSTFYNFTKSSAIADTLTFLHGSTQTITQQLNLSGALGNLLSLVSDDGTHDWNIDLQGTASANYLSVSHSNNIGSVIGCLTACIDSGNNARWSFAIPTASIAVDQTSISEAGGIATFTATLSGISSLPVFVGLSFSGTATLSDDYTRSGTSIVINSGSTSGAITVTGVDNNLDNANKTVIVDIFTLTNATAAGAQQASTTLVDDESSPSLAISSTTIAESAGSANVTVTMTGLSASTVTVHYATSDGTATAGSDYTATSGTLSWASGETGAKTFSVPVLSDNLYEGSESVSLTLSSPANASLSSASTTLTISDDNSLPSISISDISVSENSDTATLSVTLSAAAQAEVSVSYSCSDGTASAGTDYTARSGTLSWTSGNSSTQTISIPLINDNIPEDPKTFSVLLSSASNASISRSSANVTITDSDVAGITAHAGSDRTVRAGGSITLDASASSGSDLLYDWSITSGAGTLADIHSSTPVFSVSADTPSGTSVITLNLSDASGHSSQDTVNIAIVGENSRETLSDFLVGYLGNSSVIEEESNSRRSLRIGSLQILLPSGSSSSYTYTLSAEGILVLTLYEENSNAGIAYVSQVPVSTLSGSIDLDQVSANVNTQASLWLKKKFKNNLSSAIEAYGDESSLFTLHQGSAGDYYGSYVATGDINGDGSDEILVSAPGANAGKGALYIYDLQYHLISTVLGSSTYPIRSLLAGDFISGTEADIILGPDNASINSNLSRPNSLQSSNAANHIVVLAGTTSFPSTLDLANTTPQLRVDAAASPFVSMALGDLNGDHLKDLALSSSDGKIEIYFGKKSAGTLTVADAEVTLNSSSPTFGSSIAIADMSGDGIQDLLAGDPAAGSAQQGSVSIIFGMSLWPSTLEIGSDGGLIVLSGENAGDAIGSDLLPANTSSSQATLYTLKGARSVIALSLNATLSSHSGSSGSDTSDLGILGGSGACSVSTENPINFSFLYWMFLLSAYWRVRRVL